MWMNLIVAYIKIASKDIDAAAELYSKKMYPHAIYFVYQSLEKLMKAQLLSHHVVTSEKLKHDIKHNLFAGFAEYWRWNQMLWEGYRKTFNDPEFKELYERLESDKDADPILKTDPNITIKTIDKHIQELNKNAKDRNRKPMLPENAVKRLDSVYDETTQLCTQEQEKYRGYMVGLKERLATAATDDSKKRINDSIEMMENMSGYIQGGTISRYVLEVTQELIFVLPNQEELRYPEFKPLETYDENHPLTQSLGRIIWHLKKASTFMSQLDFSKWEDKKWGEIDADLIKSDN